MKNMIQMIVDQNISSWTVVLLQLMCPRWWHTIHNTSDLSLEWLLNYSIPQNSAVCPIIRQFMQLYLGRYTLNMWYWKPDTQFYDDLNDGIGSKRFGNIYPISGHRTNTYCILFVNLVGIIFPYVQVVCIENSSRMGLFGSIVIEYSNQVPTPMRCFIATSLLLLLEAIIVSDSPL